MDNSSRDSESVVSSFSAVLSNMVVIDGCIEILRSKFMRSDSDFVNVRVTSTCELGVEANLESAYGAVVGANKVNATYEDELVNCALELLVVGIIEFVRVCHDARKVVICALDDVKDVAGIIKLVRICTDEAV